MGDPPSKELIVDIAIEDWQAGLFGDPSYGDLAQPGLIPYTSDLVRVTAEFPTLMGGGAQNLTRIGGTGKFGDPYTDEAIVRNDLGAAADTHLGLISAVDSLDGAVFRPTALPGESQYSFNAYQVVRVVVNPSGGNTPPVAVADADPEPGGSRAPMWRSSTTTPPTPMWATSSPSTSGTSTSPTVAPTPTRSRRSPTRRPRSTSTPAPSR